MNCNEAYELFDAIMDCEATESDKKHFYTHLDKCMGCFDHYELDRIFKEFLKKQDNKVCCPTELLEKLKNQINNISE